MVCPRLAKESVLLSRIRACTRFRPARLLHLPLECGVASTAEAPLKGTFCRVERVYPPLVLQNGRIFRAPHRIRRSLLSPAVVRTNAAGLLQGSSVRTNPIKDSNFSWQGAGKGKGLRNVRFNQSRYGHTACNPRRGYTDEESFGPERSSPLSAHDPADGENRKIEHINETSTINCEKLVHAQACKQAESYVNTTFSKSPRSSRRSNFDPEYTRVRIGLDLCSKLVDLHGALKIFDQVRREQQVQLDVYAYNILLYLCSGAASGSLIKDSQVKKRTSQATSYHSPQDDDSATNSSEGIESSNSSKEVVNFSPEDIELAVTRAADILDHMLEHGVKPNEATYTSIVRLAVANNDGNLAFETIKLMESSGISPKLRSYGPLLQCFCGSNEADKAYEVDNHMLSMGIHPDESMLDNLLKVSAQAGRDDKVYSLLHRLRKSSRFLLPTTVKTVENWFTSEVSAFAGSASWENLPSDEECRQAMAASGGGNHGLGWLGTGPWQVRRTHISSTGSCLSCGEKLDVVDLDVNDTADFAKCVAKLACEKQMFSLQFQVFQDWLDRNGPFDAVVDGANAGLYNPKKYKGFNVQLLNALVNVTSMRFCIHRPPLVLIHSRYKHVIDKSCNGNALLNSLRKANAVYFTPKGSDDDWFWLYAAVKCKSMVMTNDEMRDHIFALLGNNFFPKWKERHQVKFSFTKKGLEIHMPPPYSTILQESRRGSWHLPQAGYDESEAPKEWLCVTRPGTISDT